MGFLDRISDDANRREQERKREQEREDIRTVRKHSKGARAAVRSWARHIGVRVNTDTIQIGPVNPAERLTNTYTRLLELHWEVEGSKFKGTYMEMYGSYDQKRRDRYKLSVEILDDTYWFQANSKDDLARVASGEARASRERPSTIEGWG